MNDTVLRTKVKNAMVMTHQRRGSSAECRVPSFIIFFNPLSNHKEVNGRVITKESQEAP